MPAVHYANLLIVVTIGLLAPLALGFFPRFRLPAIVLELVLGIVIGPSGLGWAIPDLPVSILALIGLAFLLFLSGLEIDVERLQGPVLKLTTIGFALSFAIAITLGLGLEAGGFDPARAVGVSAGLHAQQRYETPATQAAPGVALLLVKPDGRGRQGRPVLRGDRAHVLVGGDVRSPRVPVDGAARRVHAPVRGLGPGGQGMPGAGSSLPTTSAGVGPSPS
jgi:Sodium/hydrogen exchanger family